MLHVKVILIVAAVLLRDELPAFVPPGAELLPAWGVAAVTLAPPLALGLLGQVCCAVIARRLRRTGASDEIATAETVVSGAGWLATLWHAVAVMMVGWLDVVRGAVGNLIVVDEVIAALPPLAVIVGAWWGMHPIDRLLRDAVVVRALDTGQPVPEPLGRLAFVVLNVRHHLLLILAPVFLLAAWSESAQRAISHLAEASRSAGGTRALSGLSAWLARDDHAAWTHAALQLVGVAAVFTLMPLVLRVIWQTTPLGAGELAQRLGELCRQQGVRVRRVLIWRTRGTMLNGAVIGLAPRLRYVLLTDALLEGLPLRQIEAVMAHEVGHVRRGHMIWLALALVASLGAGGLAAQGAAWLAGLSTAPADDTGWAALLAGAGLSAASVVSGLVLFGFVSRRFEWQADAFAAQHLSGWRAGRPAPSGPVIADEAIEAMALALKTVGLRNHLPLNRFTFRHGSLAGRVRRLRALRGLDADRLPIDATVRRIKWACALVLVGLLAAAVLGP